MQTDTLHARLMRPRLLEALADSPAVFLHGPRQCGKTTLARAVAATTGHAYRSFDDELLRASAVADPIGFVDELPERVVLDEIQRVPELFLALKAAVARDRRPGRFLLTGSANVLLPRLSDALAGRMGIVRLHPFAQEELAGQAAGFLEALFGQGWRTAEPRPRLRQELAERIAAGGYPPALARATARRRAAWYTDYLQTLVQRDVRELSRIGNLDTLPRLLAVAAGQTAHLLNVAEIAAPFQISRPTVRDYLALLQGVFLIETIPSWHSNRLSRAVKAPKLHCCDTGLACALLGVDAAALAQDRPLLGQLLETFVVQELRRLSSGHPDPLSFHHFRDKDGVEVDLVLEGPGQRIAGVEVKAAATVHEADFRGLRKLRDAAAGRFAGGIVLYDGEMMAPFGDGLAAVPLRRLWEGARPTIECPTGAAATPRSLSRGRTR